MPAYAGQLQATASQQKSAPLPPSALSLIECLRGSARGTISRIEAATWTMTRACLPALESLALVAVRGQQSEATGLIFKLAAELVEAHISYLQVCTASTPVVI